MFRKILYPFIAILQFIQNYFKSMIFILLLFLIFGTPEEIKEPNLAKIYLSGEIQNSLEILEEIRALKNDNIKGVLLIIDSPGGSVSHSFEIGLAIKELNEQKPVISYAIGTLASGSYFASLYSKKILANAGSMIGSIGVILQAPNVRGLLDRAGVDWRVVKSGEYKEAGTIFRDWSDSETRELQKTTDKIYDFFKTEVATQRGIDLNSSKNFAEGRIFIAKEAKELGLIDDISTLFKAEDMLISEAGVINPIWKEPSEMDKFIDKFANESAKFALELFKLRIE